MNEALLKKLIQENLVAGLLGKNTPPANMTGDALNAAAILYGYDDAGALKALRSRNTGADDANNTYHALVTWARGMDFDGTTWNRRRNNWAITALASAARAADTNGADLVNYNHKGIVLFVNASAFAGDDTFVVRVEGKDPVSGTYYEIFTTGAIAAAALKVYEIHPNVAAASGGVTAIANRLIPRTWRVVFDYTQVGGVADTITASVAASYVP